jgi:hypothetical protein
MLLFLIITLAAVASAAKPNQYLELRDGNRKGLLSRMNLAMKD